MTKKTKTQNSPIIPYKFVREAGEKIQIDNPEEFIKEIYSKKYHSQIHNISRKGVYYLNGWAYDLRPFLKSYAYLQYDSMSRAYAPNQASLRRITYGKIDKIREF